MKVTIVTIVIGAIDSHQRIVKGTGGLGNNRMSGEYCILEIGQNTEKIPGDLRRLVVTQNAM